MHNLLANIAKFRQLLIEVYGSDNLINGNFRRYSNQPKAPDIEIVALAFAADLMQIDSENMLYSSSHFKHLENQDIVKFVSNLETIESDSGIRLEKTQVRQSDLSIDCIKTPDLFQTYAVTAAALKMNVQFAGLQSLRIKETDRIWAVCNELSKMGVEFEYPAPHELTINAQNSRFEQSYSIETYEDHRMAMAFVPLFLKLPSLTIKDPNVVEKSYPTFWADIQKVS